MFSIFLRRLQKYTFYIKLPILLISLLVIIYLVVLTPPELPNILAFSFSLLIGLYIFLSFFLGKLAIPISVGVTGVIFLKAVELLTPFNLGLFAVFLVLLSGSLYRREPKM